MKIAVLHDAVKPGAAPDLQDNLVQAEQVSRLLSNLGHQVCQVPFDGVVAAERRTSQNPLRESELDLVFNLVEAPMDQGRLIHRAPLLLERLGLSYTGAGSTAMMTTSNKLWAKRWLRSAGLPTPVWHYPVADDPARDDFAPGTYILKSVWEHGSFGMDNGSVLEAADADALSGQIARRCQKFGGDWFAERFIPGREFNLSLLATAAGPRVLPPAEIRFLGFSEQEHQLVDYAAKWDPESPHYSGTPRSFEFGQGDAGLLKELAGLARRCWELFDLKGWARVDFRVDEQGRPWILEVNANPCLALDAGFMAAVERAGMKPEQAIDLIVKDASSHGASGNKRSLIHASGNGQDHALMAQFGHAI